MNDSDKKTEYTRRVCKQCGVEEGHECIHVWFEIPDGCACDWREWDYEALDRMRPICDKYEGDGNQNCRNCEHDFECHKS